MSGDPGRRKKAQERRKKRLQRDARRQGVERDELHSLAGRMARAGRWPLLDCRVGWQRDNPRIAHALIARQGPSGITVAALLLDMACLGARDCLVREEVSPGEYDEFLRDVARRVPFEACAPARALKLVETAARHALDLGFRPHRDLAAVRGLFGDADPATCVEEFTCGVDGLPFYDPGPGEDVREVLRRLEARLGPQGFRYLLLPGDVEHEEEFPGEEDPDPSERTWGRLRRAEDWITKALVKTAALHFGERFLERAWDEFALEHERADIEDGAEGVVEVWALANRIPGFVPRGRPVREEEERSAVEVLLEENGPRLPELERRMLEALHRRAFSFYVVRAVVPGERMRLREVFTGEELEVRERSASMNVVEGAVLYARIVSLDSVAILTGCGSYVIPPSFRFGLLRLRDLLVEELGALDADKLRALDEILRDQYGTIVHAIRFPPAPSLENTDGEPLLFHELHYGLACPPRVALDALASTARGSRTSRDCAASSACKRRRSKASAASPSDRSSVELATYKGLRAPWNEWSHLTRTGRRWAPLLAQSRPWTTTYESPHTSVAHEGRTERRVRSGSFVQHGAQRMIGC